MDAERGNQQIDGSNAQAGVTRLRGQLGGFAPESRRGVEERHRFQPPQERWTFPARGSAKQFKAHLLAEQRILGVDGGIRDLACGGGCALAQVVDPDAGVDYLSHGLF